MMITLERNSPGREVSNLRPPQVERCFFDVSPDSLRALLDSWGEPAYRSSQIFGWVYQRGVTSFDQMTNLSRRLRERLSATLSIYDSLIVGQQISGDGTIKLLLRWPDGATSECVLIPDGPRQTACISTQVGCPVGCVFCASGLDGLERQLTAGQIVEQAMRIRQLCNSDEQTRLTNVVFMGLGEPLANYRATVQAVRTINADWGLGVGARKITISTVGLPAQMRRLADERGCGSAKMQITLALSLHAPNDELRRQIIPWAKHITIDALVSAAAYYFDRTGREVTLEYILLGGLNDTRQHAEQLASLTRRMRSNVNLIRYNPVAGLPYLRPSKDSVYYFLTLLRNRGVNVHIRPSRGLNIEAACGQLRRRENVETSKSRNAETSKRQDPATRGS